MLKWCPPPVLSDKTLLNLILNEHPSTLALKLGDPDAIRFTVEHSKETY